MAGNRGNQAEKWAEEILVREGYVCHRVAHTGSYRGGRWVSGNNDIFGCVDIIAKKLGERTRWIQVTTTSNIGRKADALRVVPWDLNHDSPEVWLWKGKKLKKGITRDRWKSLRFFQVRLMDDDFALDRTRRLYLEPS